MDTTNKVLDVVFNILRANTYIKSLEILAEYLLTELEAHTVIIYLSNDEGQQLIPEICLQQGGVNRGRLLSGVSTHRVTKPTDPVLYSYENKKELQLNIRQEKSSFDINNILIHDAIIGVKTERCLNVPLLDENERSFGVVTLLYSVNSEAHVLSDAIRKIINIASRFYGIEKTYARNTRLIHILNNTSEKLRKENENLRKSIKIDPFHSSIIGNSSAMRAVGELVRKVTDSDVMVLVLGETGTGKELIAGLLHKMSQRKDGPFIVQNCAAIPENLLESELFGYRKGAFSGANNDKVGLIEQANGGTLFLDEIGDMPINLQAKLLRVLQEKKIRPLGATAAAERSIDVRFVSATHQDLISKVRLGEFREDLYYRLSVFPIKIPPLRERREDIPELINYFINEFTGKYQKKVAGLTPLVMNILMKYHYPGNIRDLRNIIERAILLVDNGGYIDYPVLGEDMIAFLNPSLKANDSSSDAISLKSAMESYEAKFIRDALKSCNWNQTKAAEKLGIARRTIIEKIQKYQINRYITELDSTLQ